MELTLFHCLASRILRRVLDFWKIYALSLSIYIYLCIYIYIHHVYRLYCRGVGRRSFCMTRSQVSWRLSMTGERDQHFTLAFIWLLLLSTWNESKRRQNTSSYVCLLSSFIYYPQNVSTIFMVIIRRNCFLKRNFCYTFLCRWQTPSLAEIIQRRWWVNECGVSCGVTLTEGNWSIGRRTCPNVTLLTVNPIRTGLGLNPGLLDAFIQI